MAYHKNKYVINPRSGTPVFGIIPEINHKSYNFPEGNIFLKHGYHIGANRGWGLNHIWREHQHELFLLGYESSSDVARYVSDILQTGSKIFCEFSRFKNERVAVLKVLLVLL